MAIFTPAISWEAIVSETTPHATQYNYTCRLSKVNANDPGYGQLAVGYYVVDFIGHLFEIKEINYGGDAEVVRIYDILEETTSYGPYNDKGSYVYASLYDAALLSQAKLNRLDESAEDFVRSLGVDPKYVNAVQFNIPYEEVPEEGTEGLIHWDNNDNTLSLHTGYGSVLQVGQEIHIKVYNNTGAPISSGTAVYPNGAFNGYPTIGLAQSDTHDTIAVDYGMTTTNLGIGEYGFVTWFGKVRGLDTSIYSVGDTLWISPDNAGEVVNVKPEFPDYAIQIGIVFESDPFDGNVFVTSRSTANDTLQNFWNGVFRETINFTVDSNGTVVTGSLQPANGHPDLTLIFSDGLTTLDTDPAKTIILTPGTDTNPQENFIYIPKATKSLTLSTADWPVAEHIKVASVVLKSALATQNEGALKNQNWNDALQNTSTDQGHLSHISERLRQEQAKWNSGAEGSATIVGASTPDDVYLATTAGKIYQLHRQDFPVLDMQTGDDLHIVNHFTSPYTTTTNLNTQTVDALGNALSNYSFSMVLWGVQNKTGQQSHLMLNLPTGHYAKNDSAAAISDANNYSVYDIPKVFQGTGFLIARFTFSLDATGNIWTLYDTEDLRGKLPNVTAGGGGGGGGVTTFLGLTDTPSAYTSQALKVARVNAGETALEFFDNVANVGGSDKSVQYNNAGVFGGSAEITLQNYTGTADQLVFDSNIGIRDTSDSLPTGWTGSAIGLGYFGSGHTVVLGQSGIYTNGDVYIETVNSGSSSTDSMLVWNTTDNKIKQLPYPTNELLTPYTALITGSSVTWDTAAGLNRTLSRGGDFTLTLTNLSNGMSGDLRLNITSTTTITLPTSKLNGSVTSLATGIYHLAFVYDGTNLEFNIALYA